MSVPALALVALVVRALVVLFVPEAEPWGDQGRYLEEAERLLAGERYTGTRGPAYSAFLAAVQFVFGEGARVVGLANAVLGALTVLVLGQLGRRLFGESTGRFAALLLALHPRHVTFALYAFSEHLYTLAALAGVLGVVVALDACAANRRVLVPTLLGGLALGVGCLAREATLYFLPGVVLGTWLAAQPGRRMRAVSIGVGASLVALLAVLPWTLRNVRVHDELVLVGYSSGIPLFLGNYEAESEWELREKKLELTREFRQRTGGDKLAIDRLFRAEARRVIAARQPAWAFEKLAENGPLLFQPDTTRPELWWRFGEEAAPGWRRGWSLLFLPVHALVLVLGALGLAHWRVRGAEVLALGFLGFSLVMHLVANAGISRFQLPYETVWILAAAVVLARGLPGGARRGVGVGILAVLLLSQVPVAGRWLAPYRSDQDFKLIDPELEDAEARSPQESPGSR